MGFLASRRGMTLVEVIVAMGVLALVGACLMSVLMQGLRGWSSGAGDEAANSVATTALQRLAYEIREARTATTTGAVLTVTFPLAITDPSTNETAYAPSLTIRSLAHTTLTTTATSCATRGGVITILRRGVTSVTFAAAPNSVEITVTATQHLGASDRTGQAKGRVTFRNYH